MPKIDRIFAYISTDEGPDDEGIISKTFGAHLHMPFVGADEARMRSLRPHAVEMAKITGKKVRLVEFSVRSELEVIEP